MTIPGYMRDHEKVLHLRITMPLCKFSEGVVLSTMQENCHFPLKGLGLTSSTNFQVSSHPFSQLRPWRKVGSSFLPDFFRHAEAASYRSTEEARTGGNGI